MAKKNSVFTVWALAFVCALSAGARAVASDTGAGVKITRAQVYETGSNHGKLLFTMVREEKTEGSPGNTKTTVTESFTDPQGAEAIHSVTLIENGKFVSYDFHQKQVGESAKVEQKDGKLYFQYTDKNGKTKSDDEKYTDNFVLSPLMGRFVHERWADLVAGKDLEMRFGVPDRRETVGFKIFKEKEEKMDGHDVIVAKMKPTSAVIAMIVKPLYFYYDKSNGKLLEFKGRVLPKRKDGDSWKDLDAESVYTE